MESFAIDNNDSLDVVLARYTNNIIISQALYPELSTLEITLRNSINFMLKNLLVKIGLKMKLNTINF